MALMSKKRGKLHVGFSAGRFEFMARPYGIVPRNAIEEAAWPALRGQIFMEAAEIFLRLLRGDVINSTQIRSTVLTRENFRSDDDWLAVQDAALEFEALDERPSEIHIPSRYVFEDLKIIPSSFRRELLELVAGTHDPRAQTFVNSILPVKVFNLSITSPEVIGDARTHEQGLPPKWWRMETSRHAAYQFRVPQRRRRSDQRRAVRCCQN